jgi:hypothetical protein
MSIKTSHAGPFEEIEFVSLGQRVRFVVPLSEQDGIMGKRVQLGQIPNPEFSNKVPCQADYCAGKFEPKKNKIGAIITNNGYMPGLNFTLNMQSSGAPTEDVEPWLASLDIPAQFRDAPQAGHSFETIIKFAQALPEGAAHLTRFKILAELQRLSTSDKIKLIAVLGGGKKNVSSVSDFIREKIFPESATLTEEQLMKGFSQFIEASGLSVAGFNYAMTDSGDPLSPCGFQRLQEFLSRVR